MASVTDQARKTVEFGRDVATQVGNQAAHAVQGALRDGALATVGVGDYLVRQLRSLSDRVRELDLRSEDARQEVEQRLEKLRETAAAEFEGLVEHGREVVEDIGHSPATERAAEQSGVAASQVKAAATSIRKIADTAAEQAAGVVSQLRKAAEAGGDQADVAASQAKAAATSVERAADEAAEAVADAGERVGADPADVPLEDRKFVELRELAKQRGIEGRTGMNKAELIRALRRTES